MQPQPLVAGMRGCWEKRAEQVTAGRDLTGQTHIVTGGDTSIGYAVAEALATQGASNETVRGIVENLVSDGHLYSTIDDDHFKST